MTWALYQTDDLDYECDDDEMKATLEEWLKEFDAGSDIEDCPHRVESEHGLAIYRIVTATDEICCRVRDITCTRFDPTDAEPNRWIEGEPRSMNAPKSKPDNKIIKFPRRFND